MFERVFRSISLTDPKNTKKNKKNNTNQPPARKQLLPEQLSSQILDLQMECEKQTISKQVVFQLVGLYTKAVEFYEEKGNEKYKLYQKRMHNFLAKPMIQSILRGQSGQMVIKKQQKAQKVRKAQNKAQSQVKQLLRKHQQTEQKHKIIIKQQLQKQECHLQQRIRKKRAISNRSVANSSTFIDFDEEPINNEESGKKKNPSKSEIMEEAMDVGMLLNCIETRNKKSKNVYL